MIIEMETEDLKLILVKKELIEDILEYYIRNDLFLEQFEPKRQQNFFTENYHKEIIENDLEKIRFKKGYKFYIIEKEKEKLIGYINIDNIVYGAFLSCFMGYKLDVDNINRGFMTQAVLKMVEFAFQELKLHRIEANVMPRNKASLKVLEKSGFINEGMSKKYLNINGVWEDHIHMVILNENL